MRTTEFSAFIYCSSVKSIISINFCGQHNTQWPTMMDTHSANSYSHSNRPQQQQQQHCRDQFVWYYLCISCSPFGKVHPLNPVNHLGNECLLLLLGHFSGHPFTHPLLPWPNIINNFCVQFSARKNSSTRRHPFTTRIKQIAGKNCHVRNSTRKWGRSRRRMWLWKSKKWNSNVLEWILFTVHRNSLNFPFFLIIGGPCCQVVKSTLLTSAECWPSPWPSGLSSRQSIFIPFVLFLPLYSLSVHRSEIELVSSGVVFWEYSQ